MKTKIKIVYGIFFLILALNCVSALGESDPNAEKRASVYEFVQAISEVGAVQRSLNRDTLSLLKKGDPRITRINSARDNLSSRIQKAEPQLAKLALYYEAKLLYESDMKLEAMDALNEMSEDLRSPESLVLKSWLLYDTPETKKASRNAIIQMNNMLPLVYGGCSYDPDLFVRTTAEPPMIPKTPSLPKLKSPFEGFLEIGEIYESMGMYENAINAYVEAYYKASGKFYDRNYKLSDLWMKIGELESREGHKTLALRAFLKAAYLDDDQERVYDAANSINALLQGNQIKRDAILPDYDGKKILEIAEIYRKMNLHPLALSLLKKAEKKTGDSFEEQRIAIRDEWLEIVKEYQNPSTFGPNCKILGCNVMEVNDWADAPILRPRDTFWKPDPNF